MTRENLTVIKKSDIITVKYNLAVVAVAVEIACQLKRVSLLRTILIFMIT